MLRYVGSYTPEQGASISAFAFDMDGSIWNETAQEWQGSPGGASATTDYRLFVAETFGLGGYYANLPSGTVRTELRINAASFALSGVLWDEQMLDQVIERTGGTLEIVEEAVTDMVSGIAANSSSLAHLVKIAEADVVIDKTGSPWQFVWRERGTATELMRKDAYDSDGNPLSSATSPLGGLSEA